MKHLAAFVLITVAIITSACATSAGNNQPGPLLIQEQGSFAVGGTVITAPGTFDPIKQGSYNPAGPDSAGQTLQRGRAARSTQPTTMTAAPDEQLWFGIFRLGLWPDFYPGVQFSSDPEALNQFFRQMTPNTGPYDAEVNSSAVSALFDRIGPGILVTHSQSGGLGWSTAIKNRNVRAIVSYEPGAGFAFPPGEAPEVMTAAGVAVRGVEVPLADFLQLTKIPIVMYYGDFIAENPTTNPGQDQWRVTLTMARQFRDAVNRHGGDVTVVHLPELGIRGNTHFPMSDVNNASGGALASCSFGSASAMGSLHGDRGDLRRARAAPTRAAQPREDRHLLRWLASGSVPLATSLVLVAKAKAILGGVDEAADDAAVVTGCCQRVQPPVVTLCIGLAPKEAGVQPSDISRVVTG
jgi:hypothetical protein